VKRELARDIVTQYHDTDAALAAEAHFTDSSSSTSVRRRPPRELDAVRARCG